MAQGAMQTQMARAQGDYLSQRMQANQATTQLAMAQRRKAAADQARQQATGALIGGIGKIAGGVMAGFTADKALKSIGMDGLFSKAANTASNVTNGAQALNNATQAITGGGSNTMNEGVVLSEDIYNDTSLVNNSFTGLPQYDINTISVDNNPENLALPAGAGSFNIARQNRILRDLYIKEGFSN